MVSCFSSLAAGQAKVHDLWVSVCVQQNICRFYVTVYYCFRMRVPQSVQDFQYDFCRSIRVQGALFRDYVRETFALDVGHYDEV